MELDVETERGWLHNDTRAVRARAYFSRTTQRILDHLLTYSSPTHLTLTLNLTITLHPNPNQVRALLPGARINMGDDRRPHLAVEAMIRMSTADIFLMVRIL